jgi:hypothetical protein
VFSQKSLLGSSSSSSAAAAEEFAHENLIDNGNNSATVSYLGRTGVNGEERSIHESNVALYSPGLRMLLLRCHDDQGLLDSGSVCGTNARGACVEWMHMIHVDVRDGAVDERRMYAVSVLDYRILQMKWVALGMTRGVWRPVVE